MMAGPQTPVLKSNKAYGDQKALDSLTRQGTGMKYDNAGAPTERQGPGRPPGAASALAMPGVEPSIPGEHADLIENFSRASLVAQVGAAAGQEMMAGPWLRQYAALSQDYLKAKAKDLQVGTPNFS